jgi:hypothetical protein
MSNCPDRTGYDETGCPSPPPVCGGCGAVESFFFDQDDTCWDFPSRWWDCCMCGYRASRLWDIPELPPVDSVFDEDYAP